MSDIKRNENVPLGGFSREDLKNHVVAKDTLEDIQAAIQDAKKDIENLFDGLNVNIKATATERVDDPIVNAISYKVDNKGDNKDLNVFVNLNFSKIALMPKHERYIVVYHAVHDPISRKKEAMQEGNGYKFGRDDELQNEQFAQNDQNFDRDGNFVKPKNILVEYIKAFLRKIFGIEKGDETLKTAIYSGKLNSDFDLSARNVSKHLIEQGITIPELFDNPPQLTAPAGGSGGLDKTQTMQLFASRYGNVVKKGNQQQANYLLGVFSQDEFDALKGENETQMKAFCEKFAKSFLRNCGLKEGAYTLTFNKYDNGGNVNAAGSYVDFGADGQNINVNLDQVMAIKNPAEVVMILAHELTHLVDSSVNKGQGLMTKEGFGLLNNTIGGTNGLEGVERSESSEVYDFVVHLSEICYRLNPNERSAREGELIALEFMKGMNPDATMQGYIEKSINSYTAYQKKVIENYHEIDSLGEKLKSIEGQIRNSETKKIIHERLDYLRQLKQQNLLNVSGVERTVEQANEIKSEMSAEGPYAG